MRNPATGVRGPRFEAKEMTAWSVEECRRFLDGTSDDRLSALWLLALNSGMRRGELAGLRWQDVDLDAGTLAVTQQRTTADYRVVVAEPKARSRRVITLDASVMTRCARTDDASSRSGWPPGRAGPTASTSSSTRSVVRTILSGCGCCSSAPAEAEVPPIRLHDLRHTMATTALRAGIHPKVVQERLGHSSIALTLDTYSHVTPTLQHAAAETLGGAVLRIGDLRDHPYPTSRITAQARSQAGTARGQGRGRRGELVRGRGAGTTGSGRARRDGGRSPAHGVRPR